MLHGVLPLDGLKDRVNRWKPDLAQRHLRAVVQISHVNDEGALHIIFGLNESRHIVREVLPLKGTQTRGVPAQEPIVHQHSNHASGVQRQLPYIESSTIVPRLPTPYIPNEAIWYVRVPHI